MQILHSTNSKDLASKIAKLLDLSIVDINLHQFPSGEFICKIPDTIPSKVIIIGSIRTNNDLMEILSVIDAAKRAGSFDVTLVAPYIAYGRQNLMQLPISSVGIEIISKILNAMPISRLITVDIHSMNSLELFEMDVINITSQDIITQYVNIVLPSIDILIAPDAGSKERLGKLGLDTIFLRKNRFNGEVIMQINDKVQDMNCLIIDDIFDSGSTIIAAEHILKTHGARSVYGYVTHFLGSHTPLPLYVTDSINITPPQKHQTILTLAPIISKLL
jgi:ribose-phosphate pyrophosphokinase